MMSYHWDIAEQQIHLDVDDMVQDVDVADLPRLVESFARDNGERSAAPGHDAALVAELRRRAAEGRLYRGGPEISTPLPTCEGPFGPLVINAVGLSPVE